MPEMAASTGQELGHPTFYQEQPCQGDRQIYQKMKTKTKHNTTVYLLVQPRYLDTKFSVQALVFGLIIGMLNQISQMYMYTG